MTEVYLALGSNIGNKAAFIKTAYMLLERSGKISILKKSSFYFSKAYKGDNLDDFVNTVIKVDTELRPTELLTYCKNIEKILGRKKKTSDKYENRPIDIDILFYGDEKFSKKDLVIPHKDLHNRDFVVVPLNEIAPDKILPNGKTPAETLKTLTDTTEVLFNV